MSIDRICKAVKGKQNISKNFHKLDERSSWEQKLEALNSAHGEHIAKITWLQELLQREESNLYDCMKRINEFQALVSESGYKD